VILDLFVYLLSFLLIWFGAGLVVSSVDKLSRRLGLSSFAVSFFVLGILTSMPEFAVGLRAVAEGDPEIFVGNLLGGVTVIFLLVIPLLAVLGGGISLDHKLGRKVLFCAMIVAVTPSLLMIDRKATVWEGWLMIVLYFILFYLVQRRHELFDSGNSNRLVGVSVFKNAPEMVFKVLLGAVMIFVSSEIIVNKTILFSQSLGLPLFYVSLVMLSLGTNLPELSIGLRSVVSGKKDIAFGNYLGSVSANTMLFGVLTLVNGGEVIMMNNFVLTFLFIFAALAMFYYFGLSGNNVSRKEGFLLLAGYLVFALVELFG